MPQYQFLAADKMWRRRSIADALDVLHNLPAFTEGNPLLIVVAGMRLLSGKMVGSVGLQFQNTDGLISGVLLPAATKFRAVPDGALEKEEFDVFRLDGATAERTGEVTLSDGTLLRAVEVIPVHLPYHPSDKDQQIIQQFIEMRHATDLCFVRIRDRAPLEIRHLIPKHIRHLDCQAVASLEPVLLKQFAGYLQDNDEELGQLSLQKLADALATFGVRPIKARPRKPRSQERP